MRMTAVFDLRAAAAAAALLGSLVAAPAARADHHDLTPPEILSGSVNGGRPIIIGPNEAVTFQATITARADAGIRPYGVEILLSSPNGLTISGIDEPRAGCSPINATTSVCTEWFRFQTGADWPRMTNASAGMWRMGALAASNNLDIDPSRSITTRDFGPILKVQRRTKLTFSAAPNPVAQGRNIGMLGKLTVADWESGDYVKAPNEPVDLQFCAEPCTTVETPRSLITGAYGLVGISRPAVRDGSWWLRYQGSETFGKTYSPGVRVDVQQP